MACHLGSGGTLRDEREAQTWFRRAATQGSSIAATQIALFYDTLTGSVRNPEESLKWYEEAAHMDNDAVAETNLGEIYQELHRYDEAADWYRKALENDSTRAALHLAVLANDGLGLPSGNKKHRKEEVLSFFRQFAADGNAAAQTAMCFIAQNGWLDTHRDPQDAVGWFRKATGQGDSEAMVALAKWFLHSTSSSQKEEAVRLLLKAAEEGDRDSYAELGRVYESGQGTRQDPVLAYAWYRLATDLNPCPECKECESCEHERALARELTPEQMARAEARVEDFKYTHGFRSGQR
jgi:TPR repeat protein